MAYNNYFPVSYQPNYFGHQNPYYQQTQQQVQPQIQQNGLVLVQSEQEARSYPVAPGNSVTFKDERGPYCYVKTMGFNQLDQPLFEKYRLVKEDSPEIASESPLSRDSSASDKELTFALKSDLSAIWSEIDGIKEKMKARTATKVKRIVEVEGDEDDE